MTDKIKFTIGGEGHELPIDGSKTPRVGDISPDTKLTLTASKLPVTGSHNLLPPTRIVFNSGNGPAMTIHPDGRITLGENVQPTEAAAACIEVMGDMIQRMIRKAAADERAAIVAWLRDKGLASFAMGIEAGEHLK